MPSMGVCCGQDKRTYMSRLQKLSCHLPLQKKANHHTRVVCSVGLTTDLYIVIACALLMVMSLTASCSGALLPTPKISVLEQQLFLKEHEIPDRDKPKPSRAVTSMAEDPELLRAQILQNEQDEEDDKKFLVLRSVPSIQNDRLVQRERLLREGEAKTPFLNKSLRSYLLEVGCLAPIISYLYSIRTCMFVFLEIISTRLVHIHTGRVCLHRTLHDLLHRRTRYLPRKTTFSISLSHFFFLLLFVYNLLFALRVVFIPYAAMQGHTRLMIDIAYITSPL